MMEVLADKFELTELANKLFMYTDARQWQRLLDEVFNDNIWFDMNSADGSKPRNMAADAVCEMWKTGFAGIDSVHHQAGHYLLTVNNDEAYITAYAVATHYKKETTKGHTRTFAGSYDLNASRTDVGWRLTQFKYNLKYIDGNASLE